MIDRFLRRFSVGSRIGGGFAILLVIMALFAPLLITSQSFIVGRLRQITEVETRADRLLLLASARIESSRVNTMRYVQDYTPSTYEALDDVGQASQLLTEARELITSAEQQATLDTILAALDDYQALIQQVEAQRSGAEGTDISRLLFQAYRLGNDIGQRIEQIVGDSEARIAAGNQAAMAQIQQRLILIGVGYGVAVILALVLVVLLQRSITQPVAELRQGAEAFGQGQLNVAVPVVGSDELSLLGQTFNELGARLGASISSLEQRVAERTSDLEQRAVQLGIAAEVSRTTASTLDLNALTQQVVNLVRERFDLYYVGLFLLDASNRYAVLEAGTGLAGKRMLESGHKLEVGGASMVGAACARREACIALDVAHADGVVSTATAGSLGPSLTRFDNPLLPQTRTEMALPLIVGGAQGTVLGALDVQSILPSAFDQDDVTVLQIVADQVAVAIQNARRFAESQVALTAVQKAFSQASREAWQALLGGGGDLRGYASGEEGLVPVPPVPEVRLREMMDEVAGTHRKGRDLAPLDGQGHPDLEWALPLQVRDQVIGVIQAQKPEGAGAWTPEERQALETLAEQLGVALEGARLYQDSQRRAARERLLSDVGVRIRETLDMDTVLRTALQEIGKSLDLAEVEVRMGMGTEPSDTLAGGNGGQEVRR